MSRAVAELDLAGGAPPEDAPAPVAAATKAAPVAKAKRWLALDLYRFVAVMLMVQGHVFSTLLDQATKSQGWYPHHSFVHGYTAPMFLFSAGLAFGYTTFRKWDQHSSGGAAAKKRYSRYAWLLVIGYGLHLPTLSLTRLFAIDDPQRIARMLQVDVLQHIGVSLAICQVLVFLVKNKKVFVGIIATLAAVMVFGAPWLWGIDLEGTSVPVWLAGYFNASTGSIFPLIPWAGFTYLGIVVAFLVGVGGEARSVSRKVALPFLVLALIFMLVPIGIDRLGPLPWPSHNFWKTNPLFFFWRLGNILLVLAVLCFAERGMSRAGWMDDHPQTPMAKLMHRLIPWIVIVGAESLVIYVTHLLLLHGSVVGPGIKHSGVISAHSHGLGTVTLVSLGFIAAMVLLAKVWTELRKRPKVFARVKWALMAGIVLVALLKY